MMRSMFSGVSGLQNMQTAMDVIGNNISNVNTVGFKSGSATFQELFSQTLSGASAPSTSAGGTNPVQVGLGVNLGSIDTNMGQGQMETTGQNTDLAIQGNGFFVVKDSTGTSYYTRAGHFGTDANGHLVDSSGNLVQGWMATGGTLPTQENDSNLTGITIPTQNISPVATANVGLTGNLASGQGPITASLSGAIGNGAGPYTVNATATDAAGKTDTFVMTLTYTGSSDKWNWTTGTAGGGATAVAGSGTVTFTSGGGAYVSSTGGPITLTDGNGNLTVTPDFTGLTENSGSTSSAVSATTQPPSYTMPPAMFYDSLGNTQQVTFDFAPNGVTNQWNWVALNGNTQVGTGTLAFSSSGVLTSGSSGSVTITPSDGAATLTSTLDLSKLTQFSAASSDVGATSMNGYATGSLQNFSIDTTGTITGSYSNGQTQVIGQIGLATFANPSGLLDHGSGLYAPSNNSNQGNVVAGAPGTGGAGTVLPGSLEMSNVDLSQEFVNMISVERAYQANAQTISQSNTLLQTLVGLPGPVP